MSYEVVQYNGQYSIREGNKCIGFLDLPKEKIDLVYRALEGGARFEQTGNSVIVQCRSHCPGNPCLIDADWLCRKDACHIERAIQR